jgi:glycosyltransferase involved in cell wall biosynthesis
MVTKQRVPPDWMNVPVFVFGDAVLSGAPHFFYQDLSFSAILAERDAGVRTFMYDDVPLGLLRIRAQVQRELYGRATAVFAMSRWLKRRLVELDGLPAAKVHVVGAGSNLNVTWKNNPYTTQNADNMQVLYVGRDWMRKGGPLLLEAWQYVRKALPKARLVIVGPQKSWADSDLGVISYGPVSSTRVKQLMLSSTLLVLPTLWEPFGITFVEAMSCGVPAVGPNRMAVPELIEDGKTGCVVERDEPSAYADCMVALLRDPHRLWEMSRHAFDRSHQFTWLAVQQRMALIMERAMSRTAPPST